ncbi:MAG: zf-HC2 domain-containing protein [Bryobacterales bacterium]|nr:zf-HC2 domain-containing protein [Bryobacterales bacterium]
MSKSQQSAHPGADQLLLYRDGELSAADAARVRTHLEACWECRAEADRFEQTIAECIEFRRTVLREHLPPPPAPWAGLHDRMDRIDATLAPPPPWRRALAWLKETANPRVAIPLGAAATLLFAFVMLRETPSVQAAALLRRAAEAERDAAPAARPKRLRIRTSSASFTRVLPASEPGPLALLFTNARYDGRDPLSARSFAAWRDTLERKDDEVADRADGFLILTRAYAGTLREASLRLRHADLRPVQGTFRFASEEWVEVTELEPADEQTASQPSPSPLPRPSGAPLPLPGASAVPEPEPLAAAPSATDADELRVWALLHSLQADLGEPVEVSRSGGKVLVSGIGVAPQRRQEIADGLRGLPHVEVRFVEPAGEPAPVPGAARDTIQAGTSPVAAGLERYAGNRALLEQLAADSLDQADSVMARAHALRRLEARFHGSSDAVPAAMLAAIERDHLSALLAQARELERTLRPALASLGGRSAAAARDRGLFAASAELERSVSMLFGSAPLAGDARELPSRVLSSLAEVQQLARARLNSLPPAAARD